MRFSPFAVTTTAGPLLVKGSGTLTSDSDAVLANITKWIAEIATKTDVTVPDPFTIGPRMKIAIGADHAGYQLKDSLKRLLDEMGVPYEDFGTSNGQSVDYPDFARAVAEGVAGGRFDRGILVCGTGVGMAIAANKVDGVRSAPIVDIDTAKLSREHNDLNVLTLGARVLPESRAREIVRAFLQTPFEGGRHATRVGKIHAIEI
jgi:ribose 5-phosphate isomerase B